MKYEKVKKYLKTKGMVGNWTLEKFKVISSEMDYSGWSAGGLVFKKSLSGRRYIQFEPGRCYID